MNYLRLAIAILFAVTGQCSYADSIRTFHITEAKMFMHPNNGGGDNVIFSFTGPGVNITGIGGMACWDWCSSVPISDPSVAVTSQIYISFFNQATIGGKSYDPGSLNFDSLFDGSGGLNASTAGSAYVDGGRVIQFRMTAPRNGGWTLFFDPTVDQNGNPAFIFTYGVFSASAPLPTPEPATVGLMLTGLAGIAGIAKRKARFRH
jgi:PEP-CTERM motif